VERLELQLNRLLGLGRNERRLGCKPVDRHDLPKSGIGAPKSAIPAPDWLVRRDLGAVIVDLGAAQGELGADGLRA
jgi:hypothetical protein